MRGVVEQTVVERVEDGDKEKKKKRRSNRRSKQHSSASGTACASVNEVRGEASESLRNGSKTKNLAPSMIYSSAKQQGLDTHTLNEPDITRASNVAFSSMPTMHIPDFDVRNIQNQQLFPTNHGGRMFSNSCPEPISCEGSPGSCTNKVLLPSHQIEGYPQSKSFAPHWSMETVDKALEKGDAFQAVFRVNAHNRFEAYCKIDGVQTDVLISGTAAQNRAVEGDVVLVKVDPFSLWTKMKGSVGLSNNSAPAEEDCNVLPELNEMVGNSCKGKGKVDAECEHANCGSFLLPVKGLHSEDKSFHFGTVHLEPIESAFNNYVNGYHPSASDSSHVGSSSGHNEVVNSVERLCAMISSFPLKRPTGRVVAIIEKSPRRDTVIGFLNAKQWFYYREGNKYNVNKNKDSLSVSDRDYIQLTPTDPRFPKMTVLVGGLPTCIKKRLEDGDATVEMELVAAQIVDWGEESSFPQANILNIFGRGGDVEPQINAILYENDICCSEFSPESLSCLPRVPWEVPPEEFQSRRDLRNLCIFTVDPSSATDLDDALSVERLSNGIFRVGVHIADVSYFVLPDTALDIEAQIRSTSIYMTQRKLPMLPPLLSENLGSLNPGLDRLAFSIFWDINGVGDVVDRWIGRTVIRSSCKLSYEHAQDIIDGTVDAESFHTVGNGCPKLHGYFEWLDVIRSVKSLHEISKILKEKRFNDGALQLENSKVVLLFDEYGVPYDCVLCERKDSNFLVEEFSLLANRTTAEVISRAFPDSALLRRHPEPNMRKLKELESFCYKHGLELNTSCSGQFHQSLEKIKEKLKDDSMLFDILISYASKPMQLASYFCSGDLKDSVNDWGHYALAVPLYTHFTSPLRRYPDIVVHRMLAAAIEAEEVYLKHRRTLQNRNKGNEVTKCFTGVYFDKDAAESLEGMEALSTAALMHRVPHTEILKDIASYCNERNLACRRVKDACEKLYTWVLLKKKEVFLSEARVLGLGPRFMSIYIHKLAIERRIYYDEVEGLTVEWLEATSTLVLNLCTYKRSFKRGGSSHYRALEDVAWVISPLKLKGELGVSGDGVDECSTTNMGGDGIAAQDLEPISKLGIDSAVFPLTVRLLSIIPVVLHAVGGDDGPIDIGVRLYMSSYLR